MTCKHKEVDIYYWSGAIAYKMVCRECGILDEKLKTEKPRKFKVKLLPGTIQYQHYYEKSTPRVVIVSNKEQAEIDRKEMERRYKEQFKECDDATERNKD